MLYEDNIAGKINDERFYKMSVRYEEEQRELAVRIKELKSELDRESGRTMTTDMFIATVRKYTRAKKLSERMLNELIERVEVHQSEKVDGIHHQKLTIHYNCIGSIEIPDVLPLPQPEVMVSTRKGVAVSYSNPQSVPA